MVEDINQTIEYYENVLGFNVTQTAPAESPFEWASMESGAVELMFQTRPSLVEELPAFKDTPFGGSLTFFLQMEGIAELYERLKGHVQIVQDLHDTFYGMREFAIRDCNGYILKFAEPVAP